MENKIGRLGLAQLKCAQPPWHPSVTTEPLSMNSTATFRPLLLSAALLLAALPSACLAAAVVSYNSAPATSRGDGPWTVGIAFTVTQAGGVLVTQLGVQDAGSGGSPNTDGFVAVSAAVGLWDSTGGTLLATATVTSTDTLIDSYRYVTLGTPVTLATGTYLLGAAVGSGIEWFLDGNPSTSPFVAAAGIIWVENRYQSGGALAAPVLNGGGSLGRWSPANAQFTVIPEPSVTLTGIAGGLGLLLRRRRAS